MFLKIISIIKKITPSWIFNPIRSFFTAFIGPFIFAYSSGYLRSAFVMKAVTKKGKPIPWYTFSCIDFLKNRTYETKKILEFGGGQSTLWWAERAKRVVTFEGDQAWFDEIKSSMPINVELNYVSLESADINVSQVNKLLDSIGIEKYDVIVIDGLNRFEMIKISMNYLAKDGFIICDNSEGYNFFERFENSGLNRVDFFGSAPGVILPHSTSICFPNQSFVFSSKYPIPNRNN